jgi:formylglycine-generating enzyme required for sulfatase activity
MTTKPHPTTCLLPLALLLSACLGDAAPNPYFQDDDGDGVIAGEDCDDEDASVYPGAVAEAEDDECMKDADGDGFGDHDPPDGFDAGSDCDDEDAATYPGSAQEAEGDECMRDADGDGFGDHDPPDGFDAGSDCDDSDPASTVQSEDADCDGAPTEDDCDDHDAEVGAAADDADCDGVPADQDCDDQDPDAHSRAEDGDCDGAVTAVDCDDGDPDAYPGVVLELDGVSMICIGGGSFTMGSPSWEVGRDQDETEHQVELTGAYYIAVYEVTQAEFLQAMSYTPSEHWDCGGRMCEDHPVESVGWHEAAAYANALSTRSGLPACYRCTGVAQSVTCDLDGAYSSPYACEGYRLPTEAEWEQATRAGTTTAFSNGGTLYSGDEYNCGGDLELSNGTILDDIAVYCGNDDGQPAAIGSKEPNPWSLHDMHGNTWEWCHDWYAAYEADSTDPWGARSGTERVFRGGSMDNTAANVRSAVRNRDTPSTISGSIGFRLARSKH